MTAGNQQRSRAATFLLSLCLHAASLTALVSMDSLFQPRPSFQVRLPEQVIAEGRDQIVWYPLQRELPAVTPVEAPAAAASGARPRYRLPQTIAANDPNPLSDRQMILGPAPEIEIDQDLPAPNLLGWRVPRVSPLRFELVEESPRQPERGSLNAEPAPEVNPARPEASAVSAEPRVRLRYLPRERETTAPSEQALAAGQIPQVQTAPPNGLDVSQLRKAEPLRYWMQEQSSASPRQSAIAAGDAPRVSAAAAPGVDAAMFQPRPRLRYWMPEGQVSSPTQNTLPAVATPQFNAALPDGALPPGSSPKPLLRYRVAGDQAGTDAREAPRRQAVAPVSGAAVAPVAALPAATDPVAAATAARLAAIAGPPLGAVPPQGLPGGISTQADQPNLAVVGVDPDSRASTRLPAGNRRGRFAASPDGGPGGSDQVPAPETSAGVRMPNLSIAGSVPSESPAARSSVRSSSGAAVPRVAESGTHDLMTRFRDRLAYTPIPPPDLAAPGGLDPLANRDKPVYSLAINMPNITSYSGSWVIRFAELGSSGQEQARAARQQSEEEPAPERKLSAPNPRLKVDPKYIRAAAHEGVEGTVVLYAVIGMDGLVRGARIMRSLDARLDASALEAFSKWKFDPATSAGAPVDVEAVVEIPFQLAPLENNTGKLRF